MNGSTKSSCRRPRIWLAGDYEHPDFHEIVRQLRVDAELTFAADSRERPELIIVGQSRPGVVCGRSIEQLRRVAPLAGIATLLGSWCEGQARASRPVHDTLRLYWHEFAAWWQRQLALRATGRCPDWARPDCVGFQIPPIRSRATASLGVVALNTSHWDIAEALADPLQRAGYATIWQPTGRGAPRVRGTTAGIWEGGQLDGPEADDLMTFCHQLAADTAPVVALLDFPRYDRRALARRLGAAAVLGKPWINADLTDALKALVRERHLTDVA